LFQHLAYVSDPSFPSGHSMLSAVTYLTLGALLARLQKSRRVQAYLIGLAIFITIMVGLSRIYLAVHWPTDVLAGWMAGAAWALICWFIAYILQRQGKIEQTTKPPDEPVSQPVDALPQE
jgi:undecaprenyl-diphosphatase